MLSRARRSFGLRLAPPTAGRAVRIERRWRLPTLLAQLVTIPAFYLDMLHENVTWLAIGAYLTAALMLGLALWHTARATGHTVAHLLRQLARPVAGAGLDGSGRWHPPAKARTGCCCCA